MWNEAVKRIGSVKTTNYVYFIPLITMIASSIVLHEEINLLMIIGGLLIFAGVYMNESKMILHIWKGKLKEEK